MRRFILIFALMFALATSVLAQGPQGIVNQLGAGGRVEMDINDAGLHVGRVDQLSGSVDAYAITDITGTDHIVGIVMSGGAVGLAAPAALALSYTDGVLSGQTPPNSGKGNFARAVVNDGTAGVNKVYVGIGVGDLTSVVADYIAAITTDPTIGTVDITTAVFDAAALLTALGVTEEAATGDWADVSVIGDSNTRQSCASRRRQRLRCPNYR